MIDFTTRLYSPSSYLKPKLIIQGVPNAVHRSEIYHQNRNQGMGRITHAGLGVSSDLSAVRLMISCKQD
jgi:hypothetical protein